MHHEARGAESKNVTRQNVSVAFANLFLSENNKLCARHNKQTIFVISQMHTLKRSLPLKYKNQAGVTRALGVELLCWCELPPAVASLSRGCG